MQDPNHGENHKKRKREETDQEQDPTGAHNSATGREDGGSQQVQAAEPRSPIQNPSVDSNQRPSSPNLATAKVEPPVCSSDDIDMLASGILPTSFNNSARLISLALGTQEGLTKMGIITTKAEIKIERIRNAQYCFWQT